MLDTGLGFWNVGELLDHNRTGGIANMAFVFTIHQTGEDVVIDSWEDAISLLEKEYAHWRWLANDQVDVGGAGRDIIATFDHMLTLARSRLSIGDNLGDLNSILAPLSNGSVLHHESPSGATVLDIKAHAGEGSAGYALAFIMNRITLENVRTPEGLRGVILAAFPDMSTASDIEAHLKQERANYKSALRSSITSVEKAQRDHEARWRQMVRDAKSLGISQLRKAKNNAKRLQGDWLVQIGNAVADFKRTEETYKSFMSLRAPADYWESKSKEHDDAKKNDLANVKLYFKILIGVLGVLFILSGLLIYNVHDAKNEPVALYVLISGGLAVLSTIGFWIGRILTKLYLSEHHLKTDAEERRVMIMTYLAMMEDGSATAEERQIILAAIFRNTADGIVRDDGPPDFALQSLASKLLAGR